MSIVSHCSHLEPLSLYVLPHLPRQKKRKLENYVLSLGVRGKKGNDLAVPNFKVAEKCYAVIYST